jgi:carbohydrate kinase (thermoresistant glucokinase family)
VSGSGKSTIAKALAERLHWICEDADSFHPKSNVAKMSAGLPLNDEDRWPWLRAIAAEINRKRIAGESIVVGCSALKLAYRNVLIDSHPDVRIVYLRGTKELIAARLAARRGHFMPAGLLDSQFRALEEPKASEHPVTVEIDAPVEEIVDRIVTMLDLPSAKNAN